MIKLEKYDSERKNVTHIDGITQEGVTDPIRVFLDDGQNAVVKYPCNNAGTIVLVREIIGSMIGDILQIPIPEYGICELSETVISLAIEEEGEYFPLTTKNKGLCFYTKYYGNTTPCQYSWLKSINTRRYSSIVLYDYILNNDDRHDGNILRTIDVNDSILCIDNSHIFTKENDILNDISYILSEKNVASVAFYNKNKDLFDILLKDITPIELIDMAITIQNVITKEVCDEIKRNIPKEWCNNIRAGYLDIIFSFILKRVENIKNICLEIKE